MRLLNEARTTGPLRVCRNPVRSIVFLSMRKLQFRALIRGGVGGLCGCLLLLAAQVASALSRRGALAAHARDELGLDEQRLARPFQAAWTSALSFSAGAALPLLAVTATPAVARVTATVVVSLMALGLLGGLGARLGGAPRGRATIRVLAWGAVAMAITAAIGALVGGVA